MKCFLFWSTLPLLLTLIALGISCDSGDDDDDSGGGVDDDDAGDNGLYERCMTFYVDCMGYSEDDAVGYCDILPDVTDACQIEAHGLYLDCMETTIDCEDFSADASLACSEALQADLEAC